MTQGANYLEYRRYRTPREDRTAMVEPAFEQVPASVAANRRCRENCRYDFHGRSWGELVKQARSELLDRAVRWTRSYRDVDLPDVSPASIVYLAGHQPQLFHPGVWFKNFALGRLAGLHGAIAVNLVVDSDTMKTHGIRVPGGNVTRPQVGVVPLDEQGPIIPFEERRIVDRQTFAAFGHRASEQIASLVPDPLLHDYWPLAIARSHATDNLGLCLAQARHQLEGQWGMQTLELPQSEICQLPAFAWFSVHLLSRLPRLASIYNEAVAEYRRIHHIRSTAHPAPDLASDGPWLEAPYWVWTADDPRRHRLFVRQARDRLVLTDRRGLEIELPMTADGGIERAVERWLELPQRRVRVRSRALMTTLWARLVLGDLFLHGIGGAKYDQVNDALISRFFNIRPPGILVLSSTLQLPIPRDRISPQDLRETERQLRGLTWHPEAAVGERASANAPTRALISAKRRWIEASEGSEGGRTRWREIRRINEALQPWVAEDRRALLDRKERISAALRAEAVLASREYSFCLYPANTIRDFLFGILPR